jgi:hypothetical protein
MRSSVGRIAAKSAWNVWTSTSVSVVNACAFARRGGKSRGRCYYPPVLSAKPLDATCAPRKKLLLLAAASYLLILHSTRSASAEELGAPGRNLNLTTGVAVWSLLQLVPSPLIVADPHAFGAGVRWQITPFMFSYGVAERPVRLFIVEPVARHSGGVEFYASPEWTCCAPGSDSGWLVRLGSRVYLPIVGRGESAAASFGGSYVYENHRHHAAGELGIWTLSSIVGLTATIAPTMQGRLLMFGFNLRYL